MTIYTFKVLRNWW